jgi:ubiquinone/menaquinone biosynthesis C-methylase UbiE
MAQNGYDFLAKFYDKVEHLVYGNALHLSKTCFLDDVKEDDEVLVLGCGTGKFLKNASKGRWTLVDSSAEMLELASSNASHLCYETVQASFIEHRFQDTYDLIIMHYFLDLFRREELLDVLSKTENLMKEEGLLWISDFNQTKASSWNKVKLKATILFFKMCTNLKISEIKHLPQAIHQSDLEAIKHRTWQNGFIFASLLKKEKY